jgi:ribosomal protein S18 acetylase RimI-like enzyme
MAFLIRKAVSKDAHIILELLYELGRPRPKDDSDVETFERQIKQYITDADKQILVAEQDSRIVGMVSILFLRRLNRNKPEMYIPELIVTKDKQSQGIGNKLISNCIAIAKKKNCYRIRLESGNERKESHQFYKNLGFKQHALSFTLYI